MNRFLPVLLAAVGLLLFPLGVNAAEIAHTTTGYAEGQVSAFWEQINDDDTADAFLAKGRVCTVQTTGTFTSDNMEILGSNDGTNYVILNITTKTATDGDNLPADFGTVLIGTLLERPRWLKPDPGASAASGFDVDVTIYCAASGG